MKAGRMTTVCFTLKNTSFRVCVELTPTQYAHWQLLSKQRPYEGTPFDLNVMEEMLALLEHVEPEGR